MKKMLPFALAVLLNITLIAQTKITNNPVLVINAANSVTCNTGGFLTVDNSFYHVYDLANYANIVDTAFFVKMKVGCEQTTGGAYDIVGAVYTLVGAPLLTNMTFIADDTAAIIPTSSMYIMDILFDQGYALPGDSIAAELKLPANGAITFYPGSNTSPESSPTYIVATGCSINNLTTVASLGFPDMHLIMNLYVNQKPATVDFTSSTFKNDSIYFASTDFTDNFSDNDGDGLTMIKITALPANGVLDLNGTNLIIGDTVYTNELDQLLFIPNTNYFGADNFKYVVGDSSHWSNSFTTVDINVINWQLSVNENQEISFEIYPNPANEIVNIKSDEKLVSVQILDINGRIVYHETAAQNSINIAQLNSGQYYLMVQNSNGEYSVKSFIKQ